LKKRILYISPNFNLACGVSNHVFKLLTSEELKKEFNLHFITNGGDALFKLDNAEVNYHILNFMTDKIVHFDLHRNLKWLKKYCKEKEIDIIHSHHRYPEYLSNSIKKSLGIKTVVTVNNFVTGFKRFSYKSDFIIAISSSVKNHLNNCFGINLEKVAVLYNCVNTLYTAEKKREEIKSFLGIPQDHFVLLFAGRMVLEKGIETLIESFNLLTSDPGNFFLVMVGSDESSKNLKPFRSNSDKIVLLPAKDDLREFYEVADVVILPSLEEGLGYTMLESGYFKKPFIGSRTGGISEFIEDGVNGFLFEPGNATELAKKIKYVLEHSVEAKISALKLHEKVLQLCTCKEYFKKLTNIYQSLFENDFMTNKVLN